MGHEVPIKPIIQAGREELTPVETTADPGFQGQLHSVATQIASTIVSLVDEQALGVPDTGQGNLSKLSSGNGCCFRHGRLRPPPPGCQGVNRANRRSTRKPRLERPLLYLYSASYAQNPFKLLDACLQEEFGIRSIVGRKASPVEPSEQRSRAVPGAAVTR